MRLIFSLVMAAMLMLSFAACKPKEEPMAPPAEQAAPAPEQAPADMNAPAAPEQAPAEQK
jgi:hypothetical protein